MSTNTVEEKQVSLDNRIHSFYRSCLRSNRHNRQSARETTVKKFGVSFADLTRIIDAKQAEALGVDEREHRINKQLERARKAREYGNTRQDLIRAGKLSRDDDNEAVRYTINRLLNSERYGY